MWSSALLILGMGLVAWAMSRQVRVGGILLVAPIALLLAAFTLSRVSVPPDWAAVAEPILEFAALYVFVAIVFQVVRNYETEDLSWRCPNCLRFNTGSAKACGCGCSREQTGPAF